MGAGSRRKAEECAQSSVACAQRELQSCSWCLLELFVSPGFPFGVLVMSSFFKFFVDLCGLTSDYSRKVFQDGWRRSLYLLDFVNFE